MRQGRERLPREPPQGCAVLQGGLSSPLPRPDISNIAVFEVLGWLPPLPALGRESRGSFNSGSRSVSSFFCICIPNKQEIVFICMQMCLSPRLGFWIKSFTVPLIPNYTQALTWAPPPGRGGIQLAIRTHLRQFRLFSLPSAKTGVGIWI